MKTAHILFVILLLMLTFGISSAEIYKWVDENGITHYSDSPTRDTLDEAEIENEVQPSANKAAINRSPASEKENRIRVFSRVTV